MKEKKGLYPDKSVYTQQIGPGLCFGALALMLRFFFEVPGAGVRAGGAGAGGREGVWREHGGGRERGSSPSLIVTGPGADAELR